MFVVNFFIVVNLWLFLVQLIKFYNSRVNYFFFMKFFLVIKIVVGGDLIEKYFGQFFGNKYGDGGDYSG